ncbi:unnamed protein product [Adineta ricciae]|uniref:Uncharacterized protein n=1 Tax=Adineta ricciae TaxID=249248 RepID=A0A814DXN5_ADIRI|nr:unnamed protein product [Adineta ricciae]
MLTPHLSMTLKHLHIIVRGAQNMTYFHVPNKHRLVVMKQLETFTFVKSFIWKFENELQFIELLTSADIMPVLRRVNLSIALDTEELNRIKQSSIFDDYRCIDVHFALHIVDVNASYWYDVGYSTSVESNRRSRYKYDRKWLWYTLPWSFEKFFQIPLLNQCDIERELYASPSSSNIIVSSDISTLNEQANLSLLRKYVPVGSILLGRKDEYFKEANINIRITIPSDRIISVDCLDSLNSFMYTGNLRSIHIILTFSIFTGTLNWKFLRSFSNLSLLKSLRITLHSGEVLLDDEHCRLIVERVPMLIDFVFCFRGNLGFLNNDGPFNIYGKSILNLYQHIRMAIANRTHKYVIEPDGCGLMVWL